MDKVSFNYIAEVLDGAGRELDHARGQVTVYSVQDPETLARNKVYRTELTHGITWKKAYGDAALAGNDPNRQVTISLSRYGFSPFSASGEGT